MAMWRQIRAGCDAAYGREPDPVCLPVLRGGQFRGGQRNHSATVQGVSGRADGAITEGPCGCGSDCRGEHEHAGSIGTSIWTPLTPTLSPKGQREMWLARTLALPVRQHDLLQRS